MPRPTTTGLKPVLMKTIAASCNPVALRVPFINTGLQAGAACCRTQLAVSTAPFIAPARSVTIDQLSQFFCEGAHTMTFLLIGDVARY
jgi:hypothetical protein